MRPLQAQALELLHRRLLAVPLEADLQAAGADPHRGRQIAERQRLVQALMDARRAVGAAKKAGDADAEREARDQVHHAKVALGERGPTWWDGDEDFNRMAPENTPYVDWWRGLSDDEREAGT